MTFKHPGLISENLQRWEKSYCKQTYSKLRNTSCNQFQVPTLNIFYQGALFFSQYLKLIPEFMFLLMSHKCLVDTILKPGTTSIPVVEPTSRQRSTRTAVSECGKGKLVSAWGSSLRIQRITPGGNPGCNSSDRLGWPCNAFAPQHEISRNTSPQHRSLISTWYCSDSATASVKRNPEMSLSSCYHVL